MAKFKSRKFWMAVVAAAMIIANEGLGWDLPADTIMSFAAVVVAWIFAEAAVDAKAVKL
jgi:uncharacterized membrane protein